mmetsp:Transcript_16272/g.26348  ORF Transcript_16272/g.26348 Transcript_16272/m.26348 type:complete len:807 (-) Transcript_16272:180-2600(-)|eukprot:CAMPEP_0196143154 /NCGR_PEP_ID=MMETSP0910-20130528/12731_1 /TAXON_ID=49265 /ORGANISM="Thalassiosira rotula, Strain GSO102" /LENGTH=806 /DNA_ID=CAMNT_0041404557 /DNA_START=123 /DNA_END=2543 /DNA_ORIENTATION=+
MSSVKPEEPTPVAAADAAPAAVPEAKAAAESTATAPAPAPSSTAATGGGGANANNFHSASLYIGDLLPEVNEGLLFEIFNAVGPVASIRVCRDAVTRRSLGYAYVNYHQVSDAERALDSMNFTDIKGKPCRIMWSQRDPSVRRSGVGNIFVKNLHEGIDNKQLYDTFSLFGNILSCKVVTDKETGLSKGYGYVHYETNEAAASAIEKLDGMLIDGKEVQVGVFMRRDNRPDAQAFTNCFLKNIPLDWDEKRLTEEFEKFGEIVSVTISMGRRKRFPKKVKAAEKQKEEKKEEESEAEVVEKKEEGDDKPRAVSPEPTEEAEKDKEEPSKEDEKAEEPTPAKPAEEPASNKPESLGFGFVNFLTHESAAAAVKEMNDKEFTVTEDGETIQKVLFVGRAQKKAERERELRAKYESEKMDRIAKFQGVNLYVKNLDDTVGDDVLRDEFSAMGTITSARVMRDLKTGVSRGFGFVCFSTPEDSTRAVNEMNGKIIAGKPIFVALAQRRDVRRAQLEAQHNNQGGGPGRGGNMGGGQPGAPGQPGMMRGPMGGPMGGYPGAVPMYMPRPGPGGMQPSYPVVPQMMGGAGRGGYGMQQGGPGQQRGGPGGYGPMQGYGMMPAQPGRGGRGAMGRGGRGPHQGRGGPAGPYGRGRGPAQGHQQPIKFSQQARNAGPAPPQGGPGMVPPGGAPVPSQPSAQQPGEGAPAAQQQAPPAAGAPSTGGPSPPAAASEHLTPSALASATPEVQKNMIGERLYPLIHQTQPELAGKITGMLLEMDNSELLHLLESPEALGAKIQEALQVLEAHNATSDK